MKLQFLIDSAPDLTSNFFVTRYMMVVMRENVILVLGIQTM